MTANTNNDASRDSTNETAQILTCMFAGHAITHVARRDTTITANDAHLYPDEDSSWYRH